MLTKCPACHQVEGIYVAGGVIIGFDGQERRGSATRIAYCDNVDCRQTFWWYPKTGKIARRNTAGTKQGRD